MKRRKRLALVLAVLLCALLLSGCHGSRGLPVFELQEEFEESRQY